MLNLQSVNEMQANGQGDFCDVSVLRSVQAVEALRDFWCRHVSVPIVDIDFFLTEIQGRDDFLRPHVIVLNQKGHPVAMLIGRIVEGRIDLKFGYKTIYCPKVRYIKIIYGGILGDISSSRGIALVNELLETLARGEADYVYFDHLEVNSTIYELALKMPGLLGRDLFPATYIHRKLSLDCDLSEFYQRRSRNTRENAKRYTKRLEKKFGDKLFIKKFCNEDEIDIAMRDMEVVAAKTYQRGLGVGFYNNKAHYSRMKLALCRNWKRIWVLYIEDKPCAFWHGYFYKNVFWIDIPGYDPEYRSDRVGLYLFIKMIEDLCLDQNVKAVDYGFGEAQYKQSFSDEVWDEGVVYIFSPRFKGIWVNSVRTLIDMTSRLARWTMERINMQQKIKTAWRKSLSLKK